jgi:hypothetical protein
MFPITINLNLAADDRSVLTGLAPADQVTPMLLL